MCLATRVTSQSLRPITHTMLTPAGTSVYFEVNYARVTPRQRSSFQVGDWLVWQLRVAFEFYFTWKWMYWIQVRGRKIADPSKQATLGDSRVTLQNTMDDTEEHRVSLVAVNIKYNVQTKDRTEIGFFDSTTFVILNSSSSLQTLSLIHI